MHSRRYKSLSRLSLCLLLGLMSVSLSLGATWKDEPRTFSLGSAPAPALGAIDAPGHHFGFGQANVLGQTTGQLTLLALPSPVLSGGQPCTTVQGQQCIITGQLNGSWTKNNPPSPGAPSPNQFTFQTTTPNGALIPQSSTGIFIPTTAGTEVHGCTAPTSVGSTVTCTGTTSADIVVNDGFVIRFVGTAGPIDVMRNGVVGYTSGGSCPGRPTVAVDSRPDGHGRLMITVATNDAAGLANNMIYALGFNSPTPSNNAVIDIGSTVGATGSFVATLAPAQRSVMFYARPAQAGLPVTVGFTAVDACGNWPTVAGGGSQTLQLSAAPPAADVVAATANSAVVATAALKPGEPVGALPASIAPSAPVVSSAAPVSAPVISAPPAVSVPPVVSAPPAVSVPPIVSAPPAVGAPLSSAPAPSVGVGATSPGVGGQPLVFPPFTQPQPLLPFAPSSGFPMLAPPAPYLAPAAPAEAPPALAPSVPMANPDSLYGPAPGLTDSVAAPPADVAAPVAAVSEGSDAIEPPFAH